jgi:hypothetical protein
MQVRIFVLRNLLFQIIQARVSTLSKTRAYVFGLLQSPDSTNKLQKSFAFFVLIIYFYKFYILYSNSCKRFQEFEYNFFNSRQI